MNDSNDWLTRPSGLRSGRVYFRPERQSVRRARPPARSEAVSNVLMVKCSGCRRRRGWSRRSCGARSHMHDLTRLTTVATGRLVPTESSSAAKGSCSDRADAPAVCCCTAAAIRSDAALSRGRTPCARISRRRPTSAGTREDVRRLCPRHGRPADRCDASELSRPQDASRVVAVIGLSMGGALAAHLGRRRTGSAGARAGRSVSWNATARRARSAFRMAMGHVHPARYAPAMRRRFSIRRSSIARSLAYGVFHGRGAEGAA